MDKDMWDFVGLVAFGIGAWLFVKLDDYLASRPRLQDWREAAERCGLRVTETRPRLTARAGPVEVRIEPCGNKEKCSRIVVAAPVAPDFEKVRIRPQASPAAGEVTIGDPGFDDTFSIDGPTLEVFALLDSDTRRLLRAVNDAGRLEISGSQIEAVVSWTAEASDILSFLLEICKRLGTPVELPRRLVENVKRDSEGEVRLQNLLLLLREFPGDPGTVEALRAACSDWSPATRLRAARELGSEGRDALREIAQSLGDDAVSAEAVSILDQELPFELTKALFGRAWSSGCLKTAAACLKVLGHSGTGAVGLMAEVLAQQNAVLATAAAYALEATGSPDAEPLLVQALQHEEEEVRMAAARALGRIGSAAAVLPLKEAAMRSGRELRQATGQAIAEIQSRAPGASPGQLSLTEAEVGQLSLAMEAAGQLSLAPGEPGQLSLNGGEEGRKP